MLSTAILLFALLQPSQDARPTIIAERSDRPDRNFRIVYYDDAFLFVARNYGDARNFDGSTKPALFVHSREKDRWIRIASISTAGGTFGKTSPNSVSQVAWDFTWAEKQPYLDQPLWTSGSIEFPRRIDYEKASDRYVLHYLSGGEPSEEVVLYVKSADLRAAFAKQ